MNIFRIIVSSFFPNRCISCGEIIEDGEYLCDYCFNLLDNIESAKTCKVCGLPKKDCLCKYRVFHFNRCIAPFFNIGTAKDAVYRCKFSRWKEGLLFFAQRMSLCAKEQYGDVCFDGITYVPMSLNKKLKRSFNQSEVLAQGIADFLKLPILEDVLYCTKSKKAQHNMKLDERFKNVKGLYGYNYKVDGKTVLLVDDIKTTGASLDECAKQLILAGADNVYCLTAVLTKRRKEKENNGFRYWYRFRFFKNRNFFKFKSSA